MTSRCDNPKQSAAIRLPMQKWGRRLGVAIAMAGLSLLSVAPSAQAATSERASGSCQSYDFKPFYHKQTLKWAGLVRVTRHQTPLYSAANGNKSKLKLTFNQQAEVLAESPKRLKIRTFAYGKIPESTGWVSRKDLLCNNKPIKGVSGLEMKFFIRTGTTVRDGGKEPPTVTVFSDPALKQCIGGKGNCRTGASRFHMYFVFDRQGSSVLLADRYRLEDDDKLLGWVKMKDGFIWNNAFGLRPAETLQSPDGSGIGTICSYTRLDDAVSRNPSTCSPVEGGNEWFRSTTRVPVLDLVDSKGRHVSPDQHATSEDERRFFKVALARPGLVGRPLGDGRIAIDAGLAKQILPEMKSLSSKKNVDIFFLLDATASLEAVIDAVRGTAKRRGVIQEIIHRLKQVPGFKGTQFRFGFRVYRDPYADGFKPGPGDGVGEGYALPKTCTMDADAQQQEFVRFQQAISRVEVTSNDTADDYEENVYGGLKQALAKDMQSCGDHLKILFVIGDNGYKTRMVGVKNGRLVTVNKYKQKVTKGGLVKLLRGSDVSGAKENTIVPFFIQTPRRSDRAKHPVAYNRAYRRFETQAKAILNDSLPLKSMTGQHFFRMGEEKMVGRLTSQVARLSSSSLIDEIILDIRGGAALSTVIDRLRRERVDIPGVYWHILEKGACGELGKQCHNRIYDTTLTGYIEADESVVEELWVSSSALSSWIRILSGFEGYFELPEPQLRKALISAMILGLQQEIRRPPIDVSGETPAQYAQRRGGLPVRRHSPLLSYNVNALSAENVKRDRKGRLLVVDPEGGLIKDARGMMIPAVPICELRRLALWAIKSKEMLEIIERDTIKPMYEGGQYNNQRCPDATANGRALVRISGPIKSEALGPTKEYRFGHSFGGRRGYWIPQEFLP
uniref:VWFA domain-containing protein n=1 Tax=Magnetococcus massalia (strain MO-1) TaxID=451514 RepID=A0A1S7LBX5_MAGMO|nr:Conserved exported protein of unknown function [Candidatus Magnetococcus massalia]